MLKQVLSIIFIFFGLLVNAQTDSSSVVPAAPAETVNKAPKEKKVRDQTPPVLGDVFQPKVSLGVGMMSFHGNLYSRHYQAPWTAKTGYDLNISQRLFKPLQLNFNILFGKLGGNEWRDNRQENFQSEIRAGGLSLTYDFGNFIPDNYRIRPWISLGISSFEFLSKTDLYDNKGNKYYYWSDGSIKNIDEHAPNAASAVNLVRDYRYETDIRESNKDGFGKYQERAWAMPVGAGALMKLTDRFDFKIGFQYYFTTTDYIDGLSNKSRGTREGTRAKDNFVYTSFSLQYDLVVKKKNKMDTLSDDYFDGIDWLALDKDDYDKDGVRDWDDKCHGTPENVPVDQFGCPFDDDKDGVPNHADDELATAAGLEVNMHGVGLTDDYWQNWYDQYNDSGNVTNQQIVENFYAKKASADSAGTTGNSKADLSKSDKIYTVELARYNGPVPTEEMAKLLSIGDVRSTMLPDNTTVMYTAGNYKEIQNAVKRRDEFIAEGNKNAQVGFFKKDGNLVTLTNEEIAKLMADGQKSKSDPLAVSTTTTAAQTNTNAVTSNTNTANDNGNNTAANNNNNSNTKTNSGDNKANNANAGNTKTGNTAMENSLDENENQFAKGDIVYRVQLGAYKNRISKGIFRNTGGEVLEMKGEDGYFHYSTKGFKTIHGAAGLRADLVVEGYGDAFITAYKDGKRIPLSATKATVENKQKENLNDNVAFSSVDKSQISFKVQLGALRRAGGNDMEDKTKDIADVEKQGTGSGMIRYTAGSFKDYSKADEYRKQLNDKGFAEAFVIAVFKGEVISIQEALELLK
jgi:cell division septation protein DedD